MDAAYQASWQHHRQGPSYPGMVRFASVEIAADGQRPGAQARMHRVAARERTRLLDQQGQQDGNETHGRE